MLTCLTLFGVIEYRSTVVLGIHNTPRELTYICWTVGDLPKLIYFNYFTYGCVRGIFHPIVSFVSRGVLEVSRKAMPKLAWFCSSLEKVNHSLKFNRTSFPWMVLILGQSVCRTIALNGVNCFSPWGTILLWSCCDWRLSAHSAPLFLCVTAIYL